MAVPILTTGDLVSAAMWNSIGRFKIDEIEAVGGSLADFDFTGIPDIYRHLAIEFVGQSTHNATSVFVRAQVNGHTDGRYMHQWVRGEGTSTNASATTGATSFVAGIVTADQAGPVPGSGEIVLPDYSGSVWRQTFHSRFGALSGTSTGNWRAQISAGRMSTASEVTTRVRLFPADGSWAEGSYASLYGLT